MQDIVGTAIKEMSDREDMITRSKDNCVICERKLFKSEPPTDNQRASQMLIRGNWCIHCDIEAAKKAKSNGRK